MSNTDSRGSAKISLVDQPHANAVSEMQCSISQVGLYFLFLFFFFWVRPTGNFRPEFAPDIEQTQEIPLRYS